MPCLVLTEAADLNYSTIGGHASTMDKVACNEDGLGVQIAHWEIDRRQRVCLVSLGMVVCKRSCTFGAVVSAEGKYMRMRLQIGGLAEIDAGPGELNKRSDHVLSVLQTSTFAKVNFRVSARLMKQFEKDGRGSCTTSCGSWVTSDASWTAVGKRPSCRGSAF